MKMYDAIVVGARCAGASTAMLLARQGHSVLLVDRSTFPSDIPHGHFIHHGGTGVLQRWGLLDDVIATGAPPITTMSTEWHGVRLTGENVAVNGVPLGIAPRRTALDALLVDAAVDAGAELRTSFTVEDFITDGNDRVTGITGHERGSTRPVSEQARMTIGADGRYSGLARFVDALAGNACPTLTCFYFSYWSGIPDQGIRVVDLGDKAIFVAPTNDRLHMVFVTWPIDQAPSVRADIEGRFMSAIDESPDLAGIIRNGRREEPFRGAVDLPNFMRTPQGDGWALVGDAGCHKDPYMALGCGDAFRDAELLADAIHRGLSGEQPLSDALAEYERRRNEATLADYRQNLHMAQFRGLPPEQRALRAAIQGDAEAIRDMYLALELLTPPERFFNPDNLQKLLSGGPASWTLVPKPSRQPRFAPGSGIHGKRRLKSPRPAA
ncbi:MAG: NAD(P)/FAD-dependent oxidoreductase [Thermomicrobiales bacterium]|nr:NAD(P)/FAD-dependent oxidoreductase [Thermomicrobiales bacterium]